MTEGDDGWPAVAGNPHKARKSCRQMSRILIRDGAEPKVLGEIFNVVVQAVLLFGADKRVLTPRMDRSLSRFQHRVAQRLTRRNPRRKRGGRWYYPPLAAAMAEAGFKEIGGYFTRRKNTVP